MAEENLKISYELAPENGPVKKFSLELHGDTLDLLAPDRHSPPAWTRLTCHQCPACPLDPEKHPRCPIAVNLIDVVESFANNLSYEKVNVTIRMPHRTVHQHTTLQTALRSLFGLFMTTSGCPILGKLQPLALTHLPFATARESFYRVLSMYALSQFFIQKKGGTPDWELRGFEKFYKNVETVNQAFRMRLNSAGLSDACLNAVCSLASYGQYVQMSLEPANLKDIEALFAAYFRENP